MSLRVFLHLEFSLEQFEDRCSFSFECLIKFTCKATHPDQDFLYWVFKNYCFDSFFFFFVMCLFRFSVFLDSVLEDCMFLGIYLFFFCRFSNLFTYSNCLQYFLNILCNSVWSFVTFCLFRILFTFIHPFFLLMYLIEYFATCLFFQRTSLWFH